MNGGIDISELGPNGDDPKTVWRISGDGSVNDNRIKILEYGVTPVGWKSEIPPTPIEANKYYNLNGEFYFRIDALGKFKVISMDTYWTEFWRTHPQKHLAAPVDIDGG